MAKKKFNYELQEEVVSALYEVIRLNDNNPKNCKNTKLDGSNPVEVYLGAISYGLKTIMSAAGFEVQRVD